MPTPLINSIASWLMTKRMHQIELFMKYPMEVQNEWLFKLLNSGAETEFGKRYGFEDIDSLEKYRERVPLQDYESLKPSIERIRRGEQNILWNTEIKWFAKSSGTTNDKSKFIPLSQESLEECHYRGGKDMVSIHCSTNPEASLFTGKNLALGGSHQKDVYANYESYHGDVSAIIIQNLPMWAEFLRAPSLEIALLNNWDEKLEKIALSTVDENVTSVAGVPSWMLILFKRILDKTGKNAISEVWPNLEVYFHGGVSLTPYREQFVSMFGPKVNFLELYNASEGFFGIQDQRNSEELLLMLDYGIYYEFQPAEEWDKPFGKTLSLDEVKLGVHYALIISTNAGLWRYKLGDTIKFTSLYPFRFRISGRTKHYINAFGEELMIDNAEQAIHIACERSRATITEFTAAPLYMNGRESGAHEWLIEFERPPEDADFFVEVLDNALKTLNSDYEAKRYNNYALRTPIVHFMPPGCFYEWLKSKGKLGGQNKVPRLCNERRYLEEILNSFGPPLKTINS
ncbi:MAG: GH3 auxin-responsive promoter family protein [Bacteroidia bacterium]